ncbi:T9SS type A sorting domain-containing protein [Flavivirga eckloniae]|uniref:Secretion system C-terminal sorting domain-containing protein n=1 Tax=Flavivirga eckloniae TaxID=1803846 RepID=A0A2K9PTP3_9FLAO|nr:T9SS type A sorting domain-containing protein [Flavivirga eckloniae]AUP80440.1 hypothetical protein C1H87_17665 [Flavivirga eckloniae]
MKPELRNQIPKSNYLLVSFFLFLFFQSFANNNCGTIEGFEFTNGHESVVLSDGKTYSIEELPNNFYLNSHVSGYSQSIRYVIENLNTGKKHKVTENLLPYTFPAGNNSWHLGNGTFKLTATLYKYDYGYGKCDSKSVTFTLGEVCSADAGTLQVDAPTVVLSGGEAMLSATPSGDINVPEGYSSIYVLTSGSGLVIEQVNTEYPKFTVDSAGLYTIHTLVYDGNEVSPNFLDLGVVVPGTTTGVDVLNIVTGNGLCASLDVTGAPINVEDCSANAGTLQADEPIVVLSNGSAMLSATPSGDIHIPEGYSSIYVLTSGSGLVIEQVNTEYPKFTVDEARLYTIHTLVYDGNEGSPNFLDLGVVVPGTTTGVDVLNVVTGNGLCASLDVTGAPITVEGCSADAGTLEADEPTVVLSGGEAMLSATPSGDINVPEGYSSIYVLTSGSGLVIEQVNTEYPKFTVDAAGLYTIHTLVYDGNEGSPNFLDLGVVVPGTTTGVDVLNIVTGNGLCASLDVTGAPITVEDCSADAGTLQADEPTVVLSGGEAMLSATPSGNINVPEGYSSIYVLTSGSGLVIEQVNTEYPKFTVDAAGLYTIHTLVYDGNEGSPNFLDLGVVVPGTTTGVDVLNIVTGNGLCASLDVTGAPITVEDCSADAGTLQADAPNVVLSGGEAMLSATPSGDINVPEGYSSIYVLTSGSGLVIEQVNAEYPKFTVDAAGLYTIHTLVYDGNEGSPNFLDLGVVVPGTTTGVDVLNIVTGNGLCASLDVTGAPIMVEGCSANAGTLQADEPTVVLSGGEAMLSATPSGDIHIPEGYSSIYVLTSGSGLVIEQVNTEYPKFTVDAVGLYTIHTLVYDGNEGSPNFLDLGVVVPGTTTGVDVLNIVTGNGLCASLDVTGAPINVEDCSADAGTLQADEPTVVLSKGSAMLSATPFGDINVPDGYSSIYVLTSGSGLVIEQVNAEYPKFTVDAAGLYTIHTLVYDGNEGSPNFLDLGVVVPGTTTGVDVLNIVTGNGLCASLDVTGAPITVEDCSADAGTLQADEPTVVLSKGSAMLSATPFGDINVPDGYSSIYVLTSGSGLVIEQVNAEYPKFTVDAAGLYTIHTLVYDGNEGSPNFLDLGVVVPGTTTGVDVLNIVTGNGLCASLDVTGAPITVEDCSADAGTLQADEPTVVLSKGLAMLSATPSGDINVPDGYSSIYVLTSGSGLVIEQVNAEYPKFTVDAAGLYTIHTLVYDGNEGSPNFLDLSVVVPGTTTGVDVLNIVTSNGLCASLDVAGAPITVEEVDICNAFSGTMYSGNSINCLSNGVTTISAKVGKSPVIPVGYNQLYVLTEAFSLTILNVSETPSFEVNHRGFYRIHSLVYNPDTLDLSIVVPGQTTGFDVVNLISENQICASLDVKGAINLVIGSRWFCYFFNKYFNRGNNSSKNSDSGKEFNDYASLEDFVNSYNNYEAFKSDFITANGKTQFFPNPVVNTLNVEVQLIDDEVMNYSIVDVSGRRVISGIAEDLENGLQTINTSNLNAGMYLVQFVSDYRTITKKIVVRE